MASTVPAGGGMVVRASSGESQPAGGAQGQSAVRTASRTDQPAMLQRSSSSRTKIDLEQGFKKILTLLHTENCTLRERVATIEKKLAGRASGADASTQTAMDGEAMAGPVSVLQRLKALEVVVLGKEGSTNIVGGNFAGDRFEGQRTGQRRRASVVAGGGGAVGAPVVAESEAERAELQQIRRQQKRLEELLEALQQQLQQQQAQLNAQQQQQHAAELQGVQQLQQLQAQMQMLVAFSKKQPQQGTSGPSGQVEASGQPAAQAQAAQEQAALEQQLQEQLRQQQEQLQQQVVAAEQKAAQQRAALQQQMQQQMEAQLAAKEAQLVREREEALAAQRQQMEVGDRYALCTAVA